VELRWIFKLFDTDTEIDASLLRFRYRGRLGAHGATRSGERQAEQRRA
jgi:hypothetical protein